MRIHFAPRLALLLTMLVVFTAAGCTTYSDLNPVGALDYVLAQRRDSDGGTRTFHLDTGTAGGNAVLRVVREAPRERPFLGFQVVELDKRQAEQRGVQPYSGLLVRGVYEGSSAALGGVLAGDVLLAIDGQPVVYDQQLTQAVAKLHDAQVVEAKLLRGQQEVSVALAAKTISERITEDEGIPLDEPKALSRPFAGARLYGIPRVWCEQIWGEPREAVVLSGVDPGSPAWVAGFRAGDVLDEVDGEPVPTADQLARDIALRGSRGEAMHWRAQRGEGETFEGTLQLADYTRETNVWVPLVFRLRDGAYEDAWTVGPFGLLMSNRSTYVVEPGNRSAETRNVFNAVLGLIHVESSPERGSVRLLWLISFDT